MKKYTIKDKSGTKKTIFAKDLAHALTFVDSKAKDAFNLKPGDVYLTRNNETTVFKVLKIDNTPKGFSSINATVEAYKYDIFSGKIERQSGASNQSLYQKDIQTVFSSMNEAIKYLQRKAKQYESFSKKMREDSIKDDVVSNYFYFDLDDLGMSLDNAVNIMKNCGLTIVKIDKRSKEAKVYYRGTSAAEQKAANKLDISLDDSIKDSIKDEANLPTTIQALVNDEEAAIKAYEVAIKNLEGKIDETQMQVLINIMKDERRHVENLYAILNGQVTEKNLEDSIHDGVNEAKNLVESAGFKVLRAYGSDNEPYITIKWDGSYSELRKKVSALKSEAKKIGYKDVYADGNDICFSKW